MARSSGLRTPYCCSTPHRCPQRTWSLHNWHWCLVLVPFSLVTGAWLLQWPQILCRELLGRPAELFSLDFHICAFQPSICVFQSWAAFMRGASTLTDCFTRHCLGWLRGQTKARAARLITSWCSSWYLSVNNARHSRCCSDVKVTSAADAFLPDRIVPRNAPPTAAADGESRLFASSCFFQPMLLNKLRRMEWNLRGAVWVVNLS